MTYRFFFGWPIVLGSFVGMLGNVGALVYGSLGVMIKPLGEEFGWSRGDISLALTYVTIAVAVALPLAGMLIDRFGSKLIASVSIMLAGLGLLAGPFYVSSLNLFYLMIILISVLGAPTNTVSYVRVISAWFDRRRGLLIGINASGIGLGFALVPLLTAWAVGIGGWRGGYAALGALLLVLILPTVSLLLINKPQDVGLAPDGADPDAGVSAGGENYDTGLDLKDALRTRVLWLLIIIISSIAFSLNGILTQLVPMLTDRGVSLGTAAAVASTMGFSMAVSRIVVGFLIDRYFAPYVAIFVFAFVVIGIALLTYGQHIGFSFIAAVLMGFGIGTEADLMAFLVSRYFGLRYFATVFGFVFTFYLLGTGLGPFVLGKAFDSTGSYHQVLHLCIALTTLAMILFAFLGPFDRYTDRVGKPRLKADVSPN